LLVDRHQPTHGRARAFVGARKPPPRAGCWRLDPRRGQSQSSGGKHRIRCNAIDPGGPFPTEGGVSQGLLMTGRAPWPEMARLPQRRGVALGPASGEAGGSWPTSPFLLRPAGGLHPTANRVPVQPFRRRRGLRDGGEFKIPHPDAPRRSQLDAGIFALLRRGKEDPAEERRSVPKGASDLGGPGAGRSGPSARARPAEGRSRPAS